MDLVNYGGMGGEYAAKWILDFDPNAKLIVSSGYSDEPVMANHLGYGFQGLLQKPYRLRELSQVLVDLSPSKLKSTEY